MSSALVHVPGVGPVYSGGIELISQQNDGCCPKLSAAQLFETEPRGLLLLRY